MSQSDQAFYVTAAQVLPILFLVVAVERRFIPRRFSEEGRRGFLFDLITTPLMIIVFAVGEAAAFVALSTDTNYEAAHGMTVLSLAGAGASKPLGKAWTVPPPRRVPHHLRALPAG